MNSKLKTLILLVPFAQGCDSDAVKEKALSVLEHGLVQARVSCAGVQSFDYDVCTLDSSPVSYGAVKFADGAALTDRFYSAREPESEHMTAVVDFNPNRQGDSFKGSFSLFGDGNLTMHKDGCTSVTFDIETYCTGYNLEAFGVE